ncbi:Cysteine proteinase inhibitor [Abeliophyllum distichum]|uniref:Cysteine proteinase inhibitor n=1 Tax=Abeliophyllum distichum TaxID=126358 RepID=A0ABD1TIV4_9LAMI
MENLTFNQAAYSEYMDDMNNSEGFYVTPTDDGSSILGGITRICAKNQHHIYRRGELAALFAVEQHNKKKKDTDLQLLRILNLNMEPSAAAIYYITLAAVDPFGEVNHYQAKVWEKMRTGYQLQIFRVAPYAAKSSESIKNRCCCIRVDNLQPGMDENYLYHKCFYRVRQEILTIKVIRNQQTGDSEGYGRLLFKNQEAAEKFLMRYNDKLMPHTNQYFKLGWETCSRNLKIHTNEYIQSLTEGITLFDFADN